jgi:alkylation response protein AidB-like acyl-CoA dehydrogenase
MILELTDEQRAFQQQVGRFAADRVASQAAAIDEAGTFPRALVSEAAALGLMGVTVPVAWGGGGRAEGATM